MEDRSDQVESNFVSREVYIERLWAAKKTWEVKKMAQLDEQQTAKSGDLSAKQMSCL
jgi:hypothetical protein